ncbi:N-acetyltransferase family protein [Pantoea brenneri]|uniref:GNAT family N-acetyltransferase n=1 Tax=Pantoea brenneri TaxID=472694 RepID=UPI00289D9F77|nr:N-acetyltransferase family protein [Pantoea brenneri]
MEIFEADEHYIAAIQQIYAWHVLNGTGSFETVPPDEAEMAQRLNRIRQAGLPWFIAVSDGAVLGFCYLAPYRPRHAYRYTLEDSIYIDPQFRQRGVGSRLLRHAISWAEQAGYRQLIANVGDSENRASVALHCAAGFERVGTLKSVGFKHGRWLDTVFLQRALGVADSELPANG